MSYQPALGHVYIFMTENEDYYKIGVTIGDPLLRMGAIRLASPFRIFPIAAYLVHDPYTVERYLHGKLARYRKNGEWFELPLDVVLQVAQALSGIKNECSCSTFCRNEYVPRVNGCYNDKLAKWYRDTRSQYDLHRVDIELSDEDLAMFDKVYTPEWLHTVIQAEGEQ